MVIYNINYSKRGGNKLIIGLTGGIASGKTTVVRILDDLGAYIIDADGIAHQILQKKQEGWQKVVGEFGKEILSEDGKIDRKSLGEIVFNDKNKLKKLEKITHPLIIKKIKDEINNNQDQDVIVIEAPLLYEAGIDNLMDQIWVVYVDRNTQIKRLKERNQYNKEDAQKRINSQLSLEKKKEMADEVIDNTGSREELKKQVKKLWKSLI